MNRKFVGFALTAVAVGGYVYYRYNKGEIEKRVEQLEAKAAELLLDWYQAKAESPVAQSPYPWEDPKGDSTNG